ncbi:hypothetical protein Syun_019449 [Stephania yunnanensis]|uniref:Uncharacterized protein n=1 Tax=Stephania yunnanensis TaxID=152371 RepID=A0AAP0IW55_9MAGN
MEIACMENQREDGDGNASGSQHTVSTEDSHRLSNRVAAQDVGVLGELSGTGLAQPTSGPAQKSSPEWPFSVSQSKEICRQCKMRMKLVQDLASSFVLISDGQDVNQAGIVSCINHVTTESNEQRAESSARLLAADSGGLLAADGGGRGGGVPLVKKDLRRMEEYNMLVSVVFDDVRCYMKIRNERTRLEDLEKNDTVLLKLIVFSRPPIFLNSMEMSHFIIRLIMAFNGGLNSKIPLKNTNLAKIYTFLLCKQSIASLSFVRTIPRCPSVHSRTFASTAVNAPPRLTGDVHPRSHLRRSLRCPLPHPGRPCHPSPPCCLRRLPPSAAISGCSLVLLSAASLRFFSPLAAISGSSLRSNWFFSPQRNNWFFSPQRIGSSLKESFLLSAATGWFFSPQQLVLLSAAIFGYSLRSNLWKKHPEKESYRRKCVPYYDELCVIFGDDQATGRECDIGNEANIELPSLEEMCE